MTTLTAYPEAGQIPSGSHRVTVNGDRIVIHDLELFCGYDADIDSVRDDEFVNAMDAARVSEIVARTQTYMGRGQNPKLVVRHAREGEQTPDEAVGDIVRVEAQDRGGVPYIVGDVEMSRDAFAAFIESNRYPRRSAEIWRDDYMSEVALLGRETPRRPLPDTKFSRPERYVCERPLPELFVASHPGASNTYVPKLESDMDATDMDERLNKLEEAVAKMAKSLNMADDEEEKDEAAAPEAEDEKDESARPDNGPDQMSREMAELRHELAAEREIRLREKAERQVSDMEREGFTFGSHRDATIGRLVNAADFDGELSFLRDITTRHPIGHTPSAVAHARVAGKPGEADLNAARKAAKARCEREGKHGPGDFERFLNEETDKLTA